MSEARLRWRWDLCLAVALSKYPDIKVDVFEATQQFKEIGAGVMFYDRTWRILQKLGLTDDLSKVTHIPPDGSLETGFEFRRSDSLEGFTYYDHKIPNGIVRFHRAQFLDTFISHIPKDLAHFGKRLQAYKDEAGSPGVELFFEDGTSAKCDVLIGCDGIGSIVRKQMFVDEAKKDQPSLLDFMTPVFSGTKVYRALVPVERLREKNASHRSLDTPVIYSGMSKVHIISYPIAKGGRLINVVAHKSDPESIGKPLSGPQIVPCLPDEISACYKDWEPEVQQLIECIDSPIQFALNDLRPLPFYSVGRVALLGDAAHAMTPHLGAGAGQAIEDCYVLATLLGESCITPERVSDVLKIYETVRRPLNSHARNTSREIEDFTKFKKLSAWIWGSNPDDGVETALRLLRQTATI
ncbi:FAD/NAD(P)-binding domain-containing protein [Abortiporus biennis]|nr:FAD/NAD(P)-binding domain-containing protein [Abortiporus biennis]